MRFVLAMIIGGGGLVFMGVQEARLASAASAEPQTMTCAELSASGPGDNAHVMLSDFLLCEMAYIYQERNGKMSGAWIPAVPMGSQYHASLLAMVDDQGNLKEGATLPPPTDIRVVVKLPQAKSEADIALAASGETLQGLVINEIDSLGSEERKMLADSYPGVDFNTCWILEAGRKPSGLGAVAGFIGGGGVLALGGVGMLLRRRSSARG